MYHIIYIYILYALYYIYICHLGSSSRVGWHLFQAWLINLFSTIHQPYPKHVQQTPHAKGSRWPFPQPKTLDASRFVGSSPFCLGIILFRFVWIVFQGLSVRKNDPGWTERFWRFNHNWSSQNSHRLAEKNNDIWKERWIKKNMNVQLSIPMDYHILNLAFLPCSVRLSLVDGPIDFRAAAIDVCDLRSSTIDVAWTALRWKPVGYRPKLYRMIIGVIPLYNKYIYSHPQIDGKVNPY